MAEPLNLFELLTAPQCNATLVEGCQVGAFRRPTDIRLRPALHEDTKMSLVSKPTTEVKRQLNPPGWPTYGSLFNCDWVLRIVVTNSCPLSSFVDHTVLVATVWVLNPMAQISLRGNTFRLSDMSNSYFSCELKHRNNLHTPLMYKENSQNL